jgi:urease accessory protein
MVAATGAGALLLQVWTSPAFPVGAFAYSHAIEWAVEQGDIRDAVTLRAWLVDLVAFGGARCDALLMANAWRAALAADAAALCAINELALALASSRERYLETTSQGNAFLSAARAAWDCPALAQLAGAVRGDVAYPVACAAASAGHAIALIASLEAFSLGFIANLVSAAVRLGAIGQTDGQKVTAAIIPEIRALAAFAAQATLDDLGGAAYRSDLAALQHETQYSRLFRS